MMESQNNLGKYKLIGRGLEKKDPELLEVLSSLKKVNKFLNSRCAWNLDHQKLIEKVQSVTHELEIYVKKDVPQNPSQTMFFKGFEYQFQEERALQQEA